jgi:uncharacterized protein with GYD domain
MATYVVLYKFTPDGARDIRGSVKRAGQVRQQNAAAGFKILEVFWTQGPYDMVALVDAPSEEAMMGAMLNVVGAGNVLSTTMRAFDAPAMSRILAQTQPLSASEPSRAINGDGARANGKTAPKTAKAPKRAASARKGR